MLLLVSKHFRCSPRMAPRLIPTISAILLFACGFAQAHVDQTAKDTPVGRRLAARAEEARAAGKSEARLRMIEVERPSENLEQALETYQVVVAHPTDITAHDLDGEGIVSWYYFTVDKILWQPRTANSAAPNVPSYLRPPSRGELVVPIGGGTLVVDGVKLVETNPDARPIVVGASYLLFLAVHNNRMASLPGAEYGIFRIDDNHLMHAVSRSKSAIERDLSNNFGLDEVLFESYLSKRTAQ